MRNLNAYLQATNHNLISFMENTIDQNNINSSSKAFNNLNLQDRTLAQNTISEISHCTMMER